MLDGSGTIETSSRSLVQDYFARAAITNLRGHPGLPGSFTAINQNALFDAARRFSQFTRIIGRQQFAGYAVENGKSILWFRRYALGTGGAPTKYEVASGDIAAGIEYLVEGTVGVDQVEYPEFSGTWYDPGEHFPGKASYTTFNPIGSPKVYAILPAVADPSSGADLFAGIAEAIDHTAPPRGWTNQWLLGLQLKPYHPSNTSLWKPDAFADHFGILNRCHFYSPEIANDPALLWHTSYGQRVAGTDGGVLVPETPSGWNYAWLDSPWTGHTYVNQKTCTPPDDTCLRFYKSCRLYEPDVEIESAEALTESGEELVRLTLTGRLHNTYGETGGAPASIDRDLTTWVAADIQAEPFRTAENGLRLYLLKQYNDTNSPATVGDNSLNSYVQSLPGKPMASIYPEFILTKLVPIPYLDTNDRQDAHDTPLWSDVWGQLDLYLRAICEGYVDETSTLDYNHCREDPAIHTCISDDAGLYDYVFENLCKYAFGGRWLTTLPSGATDHTPASETRPDAPQGFGPLQHTRLAAQCFNQISAAVNRLTRLRVMLPFELLEKVDIYDGQRVLTLAENTSCDGSPVTCGSAGHFTWKGSPPPATHLAVPGIELPVTYAQAANGAEIPNTCSGADYLLNSYRNISTWRFSLVDPDALYAIPPAWRDMLDTHIGSLFCRETYSVHQTVDPLGTETCGPTIFDCDFQPVETRTWECVLSSGGVLDLGDPAPGWFHVNWSLNPLDFCAGGSSSIVTMTPISGSVGPHVFLEVPLVD
ncbi:MAG: hypothetical protein FJ387_24670 [Verrucomicrobia bacterium]|nr:hypothetical protein [Verrucomicrobiota bacterium]